MKFATSRETGASDHRDKRLGALAENDTSIIYFFAAIMANAESV